MCCNVAYLLQIALRKGKINYSKPPETLKKVFLKVALVMLKWQSTKFLAIASYEIQLKLLNPCLILTTYMRKQNAEKAPEQLCGTVSPL
jgi:hypothetical protein